jgi:hypothetical protein
MVSTRYCDIKINIRDCTYNDSCNYYLKFIYGYPEKKNFKKLYGVHFNFIKAHYVLLNSHILYNMISIVKVKQQHQPRH